MEESCIEDLFSDTEKKKVGYLQTMNRICVGGIFAVSLCVTATIRRKNMSIK